MIRFPARSLDSLLETAVMPRYTQSKWTYKEKLKGELFEPEYMRHAPQHLLKHT